MLEVPGELMQSLFLEFPEGDIFVGRVVVMKLVLHTTSSAAPGTKSAPRLLTFKRRFIYLCHNAETQARGLCHQELRYEASSKTPGSRKSHREVKKLHYLSIGLK